MDCWGSCWAVLMGKISQAERWILFVMLHCPPSTQSAKEASSVVLSLSVSLSSLDIVYLHQLLLPSYIPLLLPPYSARHRYIQDVYHTHIRTHKHTNSRVISNMLRPNQGTCQKDLSFNIPPVLPSSSHLLQPAPASVLTSYSPPAWECQNKSEKRRRDTKRCKQMRGLHDRGVGMREMRVRGERVKDERRICRVVKSVFVLDALETADIATIRPSFRGKERGSRSKRGRTQTE